MTQAERLFTRTPAMTAAGPDKDFGFVRWPARADSISGDHRRFSSCPAGVRGEATTGQGLGVAELHGQLREFGTPVVGPGARPYKRSRLFASLAEQLCGAVVDPQPETAHQLEIALFHAVQDVTGVMAIKRIWICWMPCCIIRTEEPRHLQKELARQVADAMSSAMSRSCKGWDIDQTQAGLFFVGAGMKADMARQNVDIANLTVDDLELVRQPAQGFAFIYDPLRQGREYKGVAIIGLRRGNLPHYRADTPAAIDGEKRLFYVAITRARQVLMYISEPDRWGNPPSSFLGPSGVNVL